MKKKSEMRSFLWCGLESLPDALMATGAALFAGSGLVLRMSKIFQQTEISNRLSILCFIGAGILLIGYIASSFLWRYRTKHSQVYLGNWKKTKK